MVAACTVQFSLQRLRVRIGPLGWACGFSVILYLGGWAAPTQVWGHSKSAELLVQDLQREFDAQCQLYRYPGATLGFVLANGTAGALATGYARVEDKTPMRSDALMLSGSIGKTYVAAVMLQLVEEGKAGLDDRLQKYLGDRPWFSRLPNAPDITLRSLLNHVSGLEDHVNDPSFLKDLRASPSRSWQHEQLVSYVLDRPSAGPVGTKYLYSDTNFILLGLVIEKITGSSYYQSVERRFLRPLQLTRTRPSDAQVLPGLVDAYMSPQNPFGLPTHVTIAGRDSLNPQIEWTGGGLISNSLEIARWAHSLYGGKVLKPASLQAMLETRAAIAPGSWYGLGVYEWETDLGVVYGHQGEFPGYWSVMEYFADSGMAVAMQFNTDDLRVLPNPPRVLAQQLARVIIQHQAEARARLRLEAATAGNR
jgi:D-alanyl-D-alanine carboxypeptidase